MFGHEPIQGNAFSRMRRLFRFLLLFIVLSGTGVYVVYAQVAGRALEWDARLVQPAVLLASLPLLVIYFAADGLRLWFTLRALGERIPLTAIARLVFLNIFVSNVTPLATGGGVAQVWFLRRRGVHVGTALAATTIRTVLAVLFIFGAVPVLLLILPAANVTTTGSALGVTLVVCTGLYIGFFALVLLRPLWLARPLLGLLKPFRRLGAIKPARYRRWRYRLVRETHRFAEGFRRYFRGRLVDILASLAFTAIFLLALFTFPALLMHALGYDPEYWTVVGRLVVTTFIMYFSPTPGASGIAEGVFGHMFADLLTAGHLVLVTVAWRTLTIYLGMAVGLVLVQREFAATQGNREAGRG